MPQLNIEDLHAITKTQHSQINEILQMPDLLSLF